MILVCCYTNTWAQLVTVDKNWNPVPVFFEDFNYNPSRYFDTVTWRDKPDTIWKACLFNEATHYGEEFQVYRPQNAIFATDSTIRLMAQFSDSVIKNYKIPPNGHYDSMLHQLHYYSGAITAIDTFQYGYFEAKCKLPLDTGSFPAFWLNNSRMIDSVYDCYEEIDIFEYSYRWYKDREDSVRTRSFCGTVWFRDVNDPIQLAHQAFNDTLPLSLPDLSNWHTYGLEWSPKRAIFYFDNQIMGELYGDFIPHHLYLNLLINYAIDPSVWRPDSTLVQSVFPNEMNIDFVKVHKLKCDCESLVTIQNNLELSSFDYKVKKKITLGGGVFPVTLQSGTKTYFRATDEITLSNNFEAVTGCELDIILHPCPE